MTENPKTCQKCGSPVTPGMKFCESCGAKIEASAVCPKCGAALAPNVKFCESCGAPTGSRSTGRSRKECCTGCSSGSTSSRKHPRLWQPGLLLNLR